MAKKVVAGLKKATEVVKVIVPVKDEKTGSYKFKEEVVAKSRMNEYLKDV